MSHPKELFIDLCVCSLTYQVVIINKKWYVFSLTVQVIIKNQQKIIILSGSSQGYVLQKHTSCIKANSRCN